MIYKHGGGRTGPTASSHWSATLHRSHSCLAVDRAMQSERPSTVSLSIWCLGQPLRSGANFLANSNHRDLAPGPMPPHGEKAAG